MRASKDRGEDTTAARARPFPHVVVGGQSDGPSAALVVRSGAEDRRHHPPQHSRLQFLLWKTRQIRRLQQTCQLLVSQVSLTNSPCVVWCALTLRSSVSAYDNEFSGTIPDGIGKLSNLQHFVLAENKLSGTIPLGFSSLPSLKLLSLYRRM